jgi:L-iditol 2-dehydrogenase
MMHSAVLVEPGRIELCERPIPRPSPGGMVVRVRAALTDGTDLKAYRRGHPRMPAPTPFGHEFSGDVAAVADDVTNFAVGDAVMCVHTAPCGTCFWCARRQEELCERLMSTMILGAYAEYIEVPKHIVRRNAYAKPADLSYSAAAFLEPLSCVVHSLNILNAGPGESVAVIGDGGFGLLHALLLVRRGVDAVLIGRREARLGLGRQFGVQHIVNSREGDALEMIRSLTDGRGADAVIECTGMQQVWEDAPSMVRRGGTVSFFGGLPDNAHVSFTAARLHYDEVRLVSPFHFTPAAVKSAYDLLAGGHVDPRPLITSTVPLDDIASVFTRLDQGEGIKFAIKP